MKQFNIVALLLCLCGFTQLQAQTISGAGITGHVASGKGAEVAPVPR